MRSQRNRSTGTHVIPSIRKLPSLYHAIYKENHWAPHRNVGWTTVATNGNRDRAGPKVKRVGLERTGRAGPAAKSVKIWCAPSTRLPSQLHFGVSGAKYLESSAISSNLDVRSFQLLIFDVILIVGFDLK